MISRLIDGQIGSRLQTALGQNYGINLPIDFSTGQKILLERLDVVQRRGSLQAVNRLLQDWPDTFVEFCRANHPASHPLIRSKRPVPFWYWRVVREQLTKTARAISKEEVLSILNYLRKGGGKLSLQELNRFLSGHSIQRAQRAGLIMIKNGPYPGECPYCRATERQFKGGFSHKGIQVLRCGECRRRYPRPDYPSVKTRTRTCKRYPETVRRKAIELYQAGNTLAQVGQLLSISRTTVFNWCRACGLATSGRRMLASVPDCGLYTESSKSSGCFSAIASNFKAASLGVRRPASQA